MSTATLERQGASTGTAAPPELWPALLPPARQGDDDLCVVAANGVRVQTLSGRQLLCGTSGLWNTPLGYGDEVIADAIGQALRRASYAGVFRYENIDARRAAADLVAATGNRYQRAVFTTAGGAANDAAMKIARQYWAMHDSPSRKIVVSLRDSFHGMTFGAFALTGEDLGQAVYGIDRRLIRHIPVNDVEAVRSLARSLGGQLAAFVLEPVQGTGTVPLDAAFLEAVQDARRSTGALLIADEVATGFGRTGPLFATEAWEPQPDVLILSKGLTNGTAAASAILVGERVASTFHERGAVLAHAETQAGTATSCAAIVATLARFRELDALERGQRTAAVLRDELDRLVRDDDTVLSRQGAGCFQTITILDRSGSPIGADDVTDLVAAARAHGVIVHPGPHGVQFVPALISTPDDIRELVAGVRAALSHLRSA